MSSSCGFRNVDEVIPDQLQLRLRLGTIRPNAAQIAVHKH